ncbi:hypothetical protein GQ42DRAFT_165258 [Ramicandelaber brevisporus]|nr:hypothetical protein GQ42DRAFT_165258 [Ramicandelaber brevisporus]
MNALCLPATSVIRSLSPAAARKRFTAATATAVAAAVPINATTAARRLQQLPRHFHSFPARISAPNASSTSAPFDNDSAREYFYFVDHHGRLYLSDMEPKNIATCYKDIRFRNTFFRLLRANNTGRYADGYPYLSPCMGELNYLTPEVTPIVFHELHTATSAAATTSQSGEDKDKDWLEWGGNMKMAFDPTSICASKSTGYVFHAAPKRLNGEGNGRARFVDPRRVSHDNGGELALLSAHIVQQHLARTLDMETGEFIYRDKHYSLQFIH